MTMAGPDRGRLEALAECSRRIMVRTGRGPLARLWSLTYRLIARSVAAYLRRGHPHSAAYARGRFSGGELVFGVSDIDLVVVTAAWPGAPGEAGGSIWRRFERLCAIAPPLRQLVYLAVYEDADLRRALARSPCLCPADPGLDGAAGERRDRPVRGSQRPAPLDPAELAIRPGLAGPTRDWGLIAGRDRRPTPSVGWDADRLRVAAWLEVQHWWRYAIEASASPAGPRRPYLCFKLVSEPTRVWLWLAHGERFRDRRAALRRALELLPEEGDALRFALDLHRALPRSPLPPLAEALACLLRLTSRIAGLLAEEVGSAGTTHVRLVWGNEGELALGPRARDPLRAMLDREPTFLPLADWRALTQLEPPDEAFAPVPGSAADPATLGAAALAGRSGPYPALAADRLLVLPTATVPHRTRLRAVQCPVTDPVSFALLEGQGMARFPDATGWSIRDTATRAASAHRAALRAASAQRGAELATLFKAARAGVLAESVEEGSPELPLTVAAMAARLDDRTRSAAGAGQAAYHAYLEARASGSEPPARTVAALRDRVLELPAYSHAPAAAASAR
jgi:hypothetical protein